MNATVYYAPFPKFKFIIVYCSFMVLNLFKHIDLVGILHQ